MRGSGRDRRDTLKRLGKARMETYQIFRRERCLFTELICGAHHDVTASCRR